MDSIVLTTHLPPNLTSPPSFSTTIFNSMIFAGNTTANPKSHFSRFEKFCGHSSFWDTDLLLKSSYPRFTRCFREVGVTWIPCLLYIATCVLYLLYVLRKPIVPHKAGWVAHWKKSNAICLFIVALVTIIVRATDERDDTPDALYVSEGLKILAFSFVNIVSSRERSRGIVASPVTWTFWMILSIASIIPLYSNFKEDKIDDDQFGLTISIVYTLFLLLALIAESFAEPRAKEYQDLTKTNSKHPSPEYTVSISNRISFWWMTGIVVLGFKKDLAKDDIFDLNDDDKCESVSPMFQKSWAREKARVETFNNKEDHKKADYGVDKSDNHEGSWSKKLDEKTPLLASSSKADDKTTEGGTKKEKPKSKKASVLKTLFADHGLKLCSYLALKAGFDLLVFVTPKITEALLDFVQHRDDYHTWRGYTLAASYFVVNILTSIGSNQAMFYIGRTAIRMQTAITSALHKKSLRSVDNSQVITLMSVDVQLIAAITNYLFMVVSSPLQVALAMYLLYDQLGTACFAGIGVLLAAVPVNAVVRYFMAKWQKQAMDTVNNRFSLMKDVLDGIKVLKLYAWESSFQDKIQAIRQIELGITRKNNLLMAFLFFFFTALPNLVQVTAFAVYLNREGYLNPTVTFVSLQLFGQLSVPIMALPILIPYIIQALVSINRISDYLNNEEISPDNMHVNNNAINAVEINNGNFSWTNDQPKPTLQSIDMEVKHGSLVAVVGTVGGGKSSLCDAMLGEMKKHSGKVTLNGSIAYVPQTAWIQNLTVKDNILFGKELNQRKYDQIIEACALKTDLDILPGGDQTEIGEKGINISGGQKQRVSLARAVYSDKDIFILDDPLSAVDSHVGKHIFTQVVGEKGLLRQKTRILVTHGTHWLPMVDKIFVINHGEISEAGTYSDLVEKDGHFAQFLKEHANENNADSDEEDDGKKDQYQTSVSDSAISGRPKDKTSSLRRRKDSQRRPSAARRRSSVWDKSNIFTASMEGHALEKSLLTQAGTTLIDEEESESGRVKFDVYMYYLRHVGALTVIGGVVLYVCSAGLNIFSSIWLTEWTSNTYLLNPYNKGTSKYDDKTNKYFSVWASTKIGSAFFVLIYAVIAAVTMNDAAGILFKNMLGKVLLAPMSFFDTTPMGRIMTRFQKDVNTVDSGLPNAIKQIMNVIGTIVTVIVNICYGIPVFLAVLGPLTVLYVLVLMVYIPTYRQLRRLSSVTAAPIMSHFLETVSGAKSIRAYGCADRFYTEVLNRINHNTKFNFASHAVSIWLAFRLQFLGNMVIFGAALFAVMATDLDASVVGLSVSMATSMTSSLQQLVNAISELETNIVSVERIKEYTNVPQEAALTNEDHKPSPDWPEEGRIVFENYHTRYRPGLDLVLQDLTCEIKGGEKVGIVGRTGAGKSSMTVALFRIVEPAGGRIIIDGEDVFKIGLHDLRRKLTILPQDPMLFEGTLRMNLDPMEQYSDSELWSALEYSYLKEFVENVPEKLEYQCGSAGANLSVGQRQLVCLARTLLRKTKILVLDEATASVDMETDDLIQKTLQKQFKECTVLTIAHRINTIIDYDKVMVLDKGSIKEFESPAALLENQNSIFYGMAKEAGLVAAS